MREGLTILAVLAAIFILGKCAYDADKRWERAHAKRCAEWVQQATSADMKVQVQMTCAKIAQDRANAAQIAAAAMTAGAMASTK